MYKIRSCLSMSNMWCSNKWIGYNAVPASLLPTIQLLELKWRYSIDPIETPLFAALLNSQTHFSIYMLNWCSTLRRNDLGPNGWTEISTILCGYFSHLYMMNGWIVKYGNIFFYWWSSLLNTIPFVSHYFCVYIYVVK